PRAAAHGAFLAGSGAVGIFVWAVGVVGVGIPIGAPFPDVAGHVVEAVAVGGEAGDGGDAGKAVFCIVVLGEIALPEVGHVFAAGGELITPDVGFTGE